MMKSMSRSVILRLIPRPASMSARDAPRRTTAAANRVIVDSSQRATSRLEIVNDIRALNHATLSISATQSTRHVHSIATVVATRVSSRNDDDSDDSSSHLFFAPRELCEDSKSENSDVSIV